jgi:hypothetical protein
MIELELGAKGGIPGDGEADDDASGGLKGGIIFGVMKGSLDAAAVEVDGIGHEDSCGCRLRLAEGIRT